MLLRSALKGQQKLAWASDGEVEGHDLGLFECDEVFTAMVRVMRQKGRG